MDRERERKMIKMRKSLLLVSQKTPLSWLPKLVEPPRQNHLGQMALLCCASLYNVPEASSIVGPYENRIEMLFLSWHLST